jgi:hypothetical protein
VVLEGLTPKHLRGLYWPSLSKKEKKKKKKTSYREGVL